MSGSPVSLGQAISIIGGSPILKNVLGHTVDHLKIPRHIDIGNVPGMSGIMSNILGGSGIGSLLQSPLGSALSPLTSALAAGQSSITAALGDGAQFVNAALQNLSVSATGLSGLADNLVGFAINPGLPTALDAIGHMNLAQSLGTALPAALSISTVMAPTGSADLLTEALTSVQPIIAQVAAGTMKAGNAVTSIQAIQSGIDAVTNASTGAVASLQAMAPSLAAGQAAVALLVAGSPEMIAAMQTAIRPDQMPGVQEIVAAYKATLANAASTQDAATSAAEDVEAAIAARATFGWTMSGTANATSP